MGKLVFGVGVNDADYKVQPEINGKRFVCNYYRKWSNMLNRCYGAAYQKSKKSYSDCIVCDEWLVFSNFKKWMETQDWQGKELDKDLLVSGNKVYCPDFCVFLDKQTNEFLRDRAANRGNFLIGSHIDSKTGKFISQIRNLDRKHMHLGSYNDELSAHLAWKKKKCEFATILAGRQTCERAREGLLKKYI